MAAAIVQWSAKNRKVLNAQSPCALPFLARGLTCCACSQELTKVSSPAAAAAVSAKAVAPVVKKASAGDYGADVLKALMGGAKAHDNIIMKARGTLNPLGVGMRVRLLAHRGTI